jgi:hypothetical protein
MSYERAQFLVEKRRLQKLAHGRAGLLAFGTTKPITPAQPCHTGCTCSLGAPAGGLTASLGPPVVTLTDFSE